MWPSPRARPASMRRYLRTKPRFEAREARPLFCPEWTLEKVQALLGTSQVGDPEKAPLASSCALRTPPFPPPEPPSAPFRVRLLQGAHGRRLLTSGTSDIRRSGKIQAERNCAKAARSGRGPARVPNERVPQIKTPELRLSVVSTGETPSPLDSWHRSNPCASDRVGPTNVPNEAFLHQNRRPKDPNMNGPFGTRCPYRKNDGNWQSPK